MPSANLLLPHIKSHCVCCFWWFEVTVFLWCLGEICNACHKISYIEFFVVYPTVPLSARGFPAHQQPVKGFSSYIRCGNLTSCNGFTRHWHLATSANCTATCCAARSKCLCNSPPFIWASACPFGLERKWVRKYTASALAVLAAGSHSFSRKHADLHTVPEEWHKPWPACMWLERPLSSAGELTSSIHTSGQTHLIKHLALP